jgi:uncharacterized membrane protein
VRWLIFIRLDVEIWITGKGGTTKGGQEKGWVVEEVWRLLGFVVLFLVGCIYVVVVQGDCVRDYRICGCAQLVQ